MNTDLFGKDDDLKYDELTNLYEIYKQIGGYPEVIKRYCEFNDINACHDVIEGLLETFQKESRNYFQDSKEQKTLVSRDEISNAISWLAYSGIIGECGIYNNGDVNQYISARRSLKVFIDKKLVDKGIVAKDTKGRHGDRFDTIPVYTVGCRFPYE